MFFTGTVKKESHVPFRLLTVSRFRAEKKFIYITFFIKKSDCSFEYILAGYGDLQEILQETIDRGFDYGKGRIIIAPDQQNYVRYTQNLIFLFLPQNRNARTCTRRKYGCRHPGSGICKFWYKRLCCFRS